jgi:hypothetical protein
MAEIRPFPIATYAITAAFFALAQIVRKRKKDPAFQASSPKNFKGPVPYRPSFFARAGPVRAFFRSLSFDPRAGPPM